MPQLFVLTGADVGRSFKVGHGATLGRHAECTVTLRDRSVSRHHAHLECDAQGRWWILDEGSRNGVTVGGERVERAELGDGEEFRVGELSLRFRYEAQAQKGTGAPAEPAVPTREPEIDFESDEILLEGEVALDAGLAETVMTPRLEVPAPPAPSVPAPSASAPSTSGSRTHGQARPGPAASARSSGEDILQYHRVENTGGWIGADLAQLPTGARWTLYVFALLFAGGLFYAAFRGTVFLRGQVEGEEPAALDESP